jgi:hypothetical protein
MPSLGGVVPRTGDLALLDRPAGTQFTSPTWLRVAAVRPATNIAGWVYLDGWELLADDRWYWHTVFVRVAGLVVRRDVR